MTKKATISMSFAILVLVALFCFILFSEHGLIDLNRLQKEKAQLAEENRAIDQRNRVLGIEIERLKNDPVYIESIARQELGMIGANEVILKPQE